MAHFDSSKFRQVLGHFPTGVTVITAANADKPSGLAVGSFASVSLDPPLVMFCPGKSSQSWPEIEAAGHFCVNVLSSQQSELSSLFASKDIDKFEGLKWEAGVTGAPILEGTLCWIDCEIETVYEAGDHWIVIGLVKNLDLKPEAETGEPLVFFKGGYFGLGSP